MSEWRLTEEEARKVLETVLDEAPELDALLHLATWDFDFGLD